MTGAGAGAVGGVGIDLALGGSSLFVGSLIGGLIGGVGAIVGFDNLYRVKVLGQKVGKRELTVGPMQNINFPYILLSRVLYYASEISKRSHASREAIELKNLESFASSIFDSKTRDKLEEVHSLLREEKDIPTELRDEYRETVRLIYIRLIED